MDERRIHGGHSLLILLFTTLQAILPDGYLDPLLCEALAQRGRFYDTRELFGAEHLEGVGEGRREDGGFVRIQDHCTRQPCRIIRVTTGNDTHVDKAYFEPTSDGQTFKIACGRARCCLQ